MIWDKIGIGSVMSVRNIIGVAPIFLYKEQNATRNPSYKRETAHQWMTVFLKPEYTA